MDCDGEEEKKDPGRGKDEELGRSGDEEEDDLGRGKESSFVVELKINTILGDISLTINEVV